MTACWCSSHESGLSRYRASTDASCTPGIRRAFVVYLASHNRPVHEVLFPQLRDIRHDYTHNFEGMTAEAVPLDALLATRERLVRELQEGLDDNEPRFLLSLVAGEPDRSLMGIDHLEHLRGIRWKLHNLAQLRKVNEKKFAEQADLLATRLATVASGVIDPDDRSILLLRNIEWDFGMRFPGRSLWNYTMRRRGRERS